MIDRCCCCSSSYNSAGRKYALVCVASLGRSERLTSLPSSPLPLPQQLGGTNLRVCEVTLLGNSKFTLRQQKFKVSDALKTGEASELFDYIAESVGNFLSTMDESKKKAGEQLYLGFTFSFPVEQSALDKGKLITWTKVSGPGSIKRFRAMCTASADVHSAMTNERDHAVTSAFFQQGFEAKNAIGHDVVQLLQDALDRKQVSVKCSALVNDTVGTLLSRAYQSGAALVGGIFGTGTNGAYVERMSAIKKPLPVPLDFEFMIINTECEWQRERDARSPCRIQPPRWRCNLTKRHLDWYRGSVRQRTYGPACHALRQQTRPREHQPAQTSL